MRIEYFYVRDFHENLISKKDISKTVPALMVYGDAVQGRSVPATNVGSVVTGTACERLRGWKRKSTAEKHTKKYYDNFVVIGIDMDTGVVVEGTLPKLWLKI